MPGARPRARDPVAAPPATAPPLSPPNRSQNPVCSPAHSAGRRAETTAPRLRSYALERCCDALRTYLQGKARSSGSTPSTIAPPLARAVLRSFTRGGDGAGVHRRNWRDGAAARALSSREPANVPTGQSAHILPSHARRHRRCLCQCWRAARRPRVSGCESDLAIYAAKGSNGQVPPRRAPSAECGRSSHACSGEASARTVAAHTVAAAGVVLDGQAYGTAGAARGALRR